MTPDPPPQDPEPAPLTPYEGGTLGAGIDWSDPNSPLAPFYLTVAGVLCVFVLGLAVFLMSVFPLWHTDFWAHLKYGEWISAERKLPDREPLSPFTDKHQPMFDALWLTQVGYHGLFRAGSSAAGGDAARHMAGGVEFIRIAHTLAAVATLALLGLAYRRVSGSVAWGAIGMLLVLGLMLTPLGTQRPQAFALVGYAAVLCGLSRPVPTRRAVLWMPLVVVLWANLHGSFVVGIALIGAVMLGRGIEVFRETASARAIWRDVAIRRLVAILMLSVAAVAVLNPYGPALYLNVVRFGGNPNLRTIAEWQPLDFSHPRGGHWAYFAVVILLVLTQLTSPRPFTPTQVLLVITVGIWPLFQQRAMSWWLPLVPWLIAPHWVAAAGRWGLRLPEDVPSFRKTMLAVLLMGLAVLVAPLSTWAKTGRPRPLTTALHPGTPADVAAALMGQEPVNPNRVAELVKVIQKQYGGRYTGRVFTSEVQGEYLLWALPADAPVMLYNHAQLFAPDYWTECLTVKAAGPGWWEVLDRYRVGVVVVEHDPHARLCEELRKHPGWQVVVDEAKAPARDPFSRLFVAVRKPASPAGVAP